MKHILCIAAIAVVGAGAFWGGMKYDQSKAPAWGPGMMQNLTAEQRQQMFQGRTGGRQGFRTGTDAQGDVVSGEILSKDAESFTVKLRDGGSRIILYSDATRIMKFAEGTTQDLEAGKNVTITGTTNPDGSITAQSIQVRPLMPAPSSSPSI